MGSDHYKISPRQKMINLMYIVLTAMLALNVSSDVLDGFSEVEHGVSISNSNLSMRNRTILTTLHDFAQRNPEKGEKWYRQAIIATNGADSLYRLIDSLKLLIVREADGPSGSLDNIVSREDLEAPSAVLLNPIDRKGAALRKEIENYRAVLLSMLTTDSLKRSLVATLLSTESSTPLQNWEELKFDNKPVVAAVTLLSQLQNDVRNAEGETLDELLKNVDAGDVRVNKLDAFVLPRSQVIMRGGKYSADIVLAAVDSTEQPIITVNGTELNRGSNRFETIAAGNGLVHYEGKIKVPHPDGSYTVHPFEGSYTVIEPMATVSATMMNVLYAGIDNPISISVPGVPQSDISAHISNGTITRNGNLWMVRPLEIGKDVEINVSANIDGQNSQVASHKFRVRKLPDPSPFISYTDNEGQPQIYRGGRPISKNHLLASNGIQAAIDDELLNIAFKVNSFETVFFDSMGNAMVEVSEGPQFSGRQKDAFRRLNRGKRFYISKVKATGPDGILRDISPLEVIVN